jgi:hypothetical protein
MCKSNILSFCNVQSPYPLTFNLGLDFLGTLNASFEVAMKDGNLNFRRSHIAVRLIAVTNLVLYACALVAAIYRYKVPRCDLYFIAVLWFCISSALLPIYVIFEIFLIPKVSLAEREATVKAILIDGLLAIACFVTLIIGGYLYFWIPSPRC